MHLQPKLTAYNKHPKIKKSAKWARRHSVHATVTTNMDLLRVNLAYSSNWTRFSHGSQDTTRRIIFPTTCPISWRNILLQAAPKMSSGFHAKVNIQQIRNILETSGITRKEELKDSRDVSIHSPSKMVTSNLCLQFSLHHLNVSFIEIFLPIQFDSKFIFSFSQLELL